MCQREAPIATRIAISFCRPPAFAKSRLATFEQAINSTSPTTAINISRNSGAVSPMPRASGRRLRCAGTMSISFLLFVSGYSLASCCWSMLVFAAACSMPTPGLSRAAICIQWWPRDVAST